MKLIADLHIHSHYSRATSPLLTPPWLERWARIKGIGLLGTGDCTHPEWLKELRSQMDDAGEGFYVLKSEIRNAFDSGPALGLPLPGKALASANKGAGLTSTADMPRFVLTGEISTIYKKNDKVRKVHHVVILPDFKAALAFCTRLEGIGCNIRSDGRPIVGLDSRDLLALLLETDEKAMLVPAHIWTPWFSALGANSGFDSIEECYGDLSEHIHAVETGLSSNPPMNWALHSLDKYLIVSNSDAHSPGKLGREATIFDIDLSYSSLHRALTSVTSGSVLGTIEFFPQEGKYHYDGHRKCGFSLGPELALQTQVAGKTVCPVCGKVLTRGVMGRVMELSGRTVNETEPCPADYVASNRRPYYSLIPLQELIAELLCTGETSKRVEHVYFRLIEKGGPELSILIEAGRENLEKLDIPELSGAVLAEAILKMRSGDVSVSAGYDGEYGKIRVFGPGSIDCKIGKEGEGNLFGDIAIDTKIDDIQKAMASSGKKVPGKKPQSDLSAKQKVDLLTRPKAEWPTKPNIAAQSRIRPDREGIESAPAAFVPDEDQEKVISYNGSGLIVIAGPGTGKTAVLTARIDRLVKDGVSPLSILALTFTVKAAAELRERLMRLSFVNSAGTAVPGAIVNRAIMPGAIIPGAVTSATFHSFCCSALREYSEVTGLPGLFKIIGEDERDSLLREIGGKQGRRLGLYIEEMKRYLLLPGELVPGFLMKVNINEQLRFGSGEWTFPPADTAMEIFYSRYRDAL
ncbi:MAG: UvrD-helicase domain-containing protein, partial [Treponema sp.]|nr:UvrD-helicase domain-containing protein [Treponema sp.]